MAFQSITVCLDMHGCPNRCKHCWLGHTPNANLSEDDLRFVAESFRPFTESLEVVDWYREPDMTDDYQSLWELCGELSDRQHEHYELASIPRLVSDDNYVVWLKQQGVKVVQLTLFGGEKTTDFMTGRRGAYRDIMSAVEVLLSHGICPRFQLFINKNNIDELPHIDTLIDELDLIRRCEDIGGKFAFFLHSGSCDGENEQFYEVFPTISDIQKIPPRLLEFAKAHWDSDIEGIFGHPECQLIAELEQSDETSCPVTETPVFFVDAQFNVYPNITTPTVYSCLGNLKTDGAEAVIANYLANKSALQKVMSTVPICEIVAKFGDRLSERLFVKSDYISYVTNKYVREFT